jgi:hypothetical protein
MPNWNSVLHEVNVAAVEAQQRAQSALDDVRRKYLKNLNTYTSRNVIAYYSGWLSKPNVAQVDINDEDKNGFMMAVHDLDRTKGLAARRKSGMGILPMRRRGVSPLQDGGKPSKSTGGTPVGRTAGTAVPRKTPFSTGC